MPDKRLSDFCGKCGSKLKGDVAFCPKCGHPVEGATLQTEPVQPTPQASSGSNKVWGIDKRIFIVVVIFLILIVPVFPRDKTIYVAGTTQTVTTSTSSNTSFQTYATQSQGSMKVYKGTLQYVTDSYYNSYYQYGYYNNCYQDPYTGYIYCNDYNYWPNYGQSSYYYTVTIDPSDNVVKMQQTQESYGLWTLILTHQDGSSDTYRHVYQEDLTQTGVVSVQVTVTATSTTTNTVVNPVTFTVPCEACNPKQVTERVSLLQLILGYFGYSQ